MAAVLGSRRTKRPSLLLAVTACVMAATTVAAPVAAQTSTPTLFDGARLIRGDGTVIDDAAFIVDGNRIVAVGRRADVQQPAGAARVDLAGKTVIPALIDAHSHIGYMKDLTNGPQNDTRENILDHMHRFAYFGVAVSQAKGSDVGELPFHLR